MFQFLFGNTTMSGIPENSSRRSFKTQNQILFGGIILIFSADENERKSKPFFLSYFRKIIYRITLFCKSLVSSHSYLCVFICNTRIVLHRSLYQSTLHIILGNL